jgi:cytoskeletal protein CcmA (bactofilin family)
MSKKEAIANPNSVNRIVSTTSITGEIKTDSDIKFDGKLDGKLITKNKLVIGETGEIKGEIHCKSAVISGKIEGKIFVEETITLQDTCKIVGDITTNKIAIEPGAIFNGTCTMGKTLENLEKK